jgi:hypothetical protein
VTGTSPGPMTGERSRRISPDRGRRHGKLPGIAGNYTGNYRDSCNNPQITPSSPHTPYPTDPARQPGCARPISAFLHTVESGRIAIALSTVEISAAGRRQGPVCAVWAGREFRTLDSVNFANLTRAASPQPQRRTGRANAFWSRPAPEDVRGSGASGPRKFPFNPFNPPAIPRRSALPPAGRSGRVPPG